MSSSTSQTSNSRFTRLIDSIASERSAADTAPRALSLEISAIFISSVFGSVWQATLGRCAVGAVEEFEKACIGCWGALLLRPMSAPTHCHLPVLLRAPAPQK